MKSTIEVNVKPNIAAKLFMIRAIESNTIMTSEECERMINCVLDIDIDELLDLIDSTKIGFEMQISDIPQFGSLDSVKNVPILIMQDRKRELNYAQLGYKLREGKKASVQADTKYGENNGKGATMIGVVDYFDGKIRSSHITEYFVELSDDKKDLLVRKLFLRMPIIQLLIKSAKDEAINGFVFLKMLSETTKNRRATCLKMIMKN